MPIYRYAVENTDYKSSIKSKDYIDWPIEFNSTHHLEDKLWRPSLNAIESEIEDKELAEEIFENEFNGNIDKDGIEIKAIWRLYKDGSVKLHSVKYDNQTYDSYSEDSYGHQP